MNACLVDEEGRLEESHGLAHGRLDVQGLDILPILLQQRDEEVDGYKRISITTRQSETEYLPSITLAKTWSSVIWT